MLLGTDAPCGDIRGSEKVQSLYDIASKAGKVWAQATSLYGGQWHATADVSCAHDRPGHPHLCALIQRAALPGANIPARRSRP
eukprot:3121731-Rhodomonas_salina.2